MRRPTTLRRVRPAIHRLEDRLTPAQLLPDLQVFSSYLSGWTVNPTNGGGREVRYATAVYNGGTGAFELNGTSTIITHPDGSLGQVVNQRVYNSDGSSTTRVAGTFAYHPAHGHTHFDGFAEGRIRLRPADQSVGAVVAAGPKTSFCMLDNSHANPSLPGSPPSSVYFTCTNQKQGISVGWSDVYGSALEGQSIDVTGLPNGDYWLEVEVDPLAAIQETDDSNNFARVPITLSNLPPTGFRILSASPVGAQVDAVGAVTLSFNAAVNAASFQPSDFVLTGPSGVIPVSSVVPLSDTQFRVEFPVQSAVGTYSMAVGPDISSATGVALDQNNDGTGGQPADQFFNIFVIAAPRVNSVAPTGTIYNSISSVRVTFSKPMNSASFTAADLFSFTGPGGTNLLPSVTGIAPASTGGTSAIFDVNFTPQTAIGAYNLTFEPTILDNLGHPIDQDGDGLSNAADRYAVTFTISDVGPVGPDSFGYVATTAPGLSFDLVGRSGAFTLLASGDDESASVNLGTNTFNFYGTTYSGGGQLFVNMNGLITFGGTNGSPNNDDLTASSLPTIAVLWDDWRSSTASPAVLGYFDDQDGDGTPDRLILQWNQLWHHPSTPSTVTFQAVLQLNTGPTPGAIHLNYVDLDAGNSAYTAGASATVGTRSATDRLLVSFSTTNNNANPLVSSGPAVLVSTPAVASIVREGPATVDAGDAEFLVTFSRGVTGVDITDFSLSTTGSIAGAKLDHIHPTADPAVYEVHVATGTGSGALRLDLADNDSIADLFGAKLGGAGAGNGNFNRGEAYTVAQSAPRVLGVTVGNGDLVTTPVNSITVVFDWLVQFAGSPTAAFQLLGAGGAVPLSVDLSGSSPVNTVAKVQFATLPAGSYTFTAFGSAISTGGVNLDGDGNGSPGGNSVTGFYVGRPTSILATAAGAGDLPGQQGDPFVVVYNPDGSIRFGFYAYDRSFRLGVRVATGDINGDGVNDIVTSPGPGGGPHVRAFSGVDGKLLTEFFAYPASMTAGVFVATGDVDGDGRADIITGAGVGRGTYNDPRVRVFSGRQPNSPPIRDFVAYPTYNVGVTVAAADFNSDGRADIVTGPESGNPNVKLFNGANPGGPLLRDFFAYAPTTPGGAIYYPVGVTVAAGDFDGDARPDIITGAGTGGGPHVRAFSGLNNAILREFFAYPDAVRGGLRLAALDVNGDNRVEIITAVGPTPNGATPSKVRFFNSVGSVTRELDPFPSFRGGVFVG